LNQRKREEEGREGKRVRGEWKIARYFEEELREIMGVRVGDDIRDRE